MSSSDLAQYVDYIRVGALALVALLAVITAFKRSQARTAPRDLVYGVLFAIVVVAMGVISPVTSWLYFAVLFAAGLVIGLLLGGVRPLIAWIGAFATIYFAMGLLFDQGGAFAPALAVFALGAAAALGQGISGKVRRPALAPEGGANKPPDAAQGA